MLILNKCRKNTMAFLFPLKRDGGSGPYSAGRIGIAPNNDLVMFPTLESSPQATHVRSEVGFLCTLPPHRSRCSH